MSDPIKPSDKPIVAEEKKFVAPPPVVPPAKSAKTTEADTLRGQITDTLAQYGGHESDIPTNHPYWTWVNQARGLK